MSSSHTQGAGGFDSYLTDDSIWLSVETNAMYVALPRDVRHGFLGRFPAVDTTGTTNDKGRAGM